MSSRAKTVAIILAAVVAVTIAVLFLPGCALSRTDAARVAVTNAALAETEAMQLLAKYDKTEQQSILDRAKAANDRTMGETELTAYRQKRRIAEESIVVAATVTANAASVIDLVEQGKAKRPDLDALITELLKALNHVRQTLASLGVGGGTWGPATATP